MRKSKRKIYPPDDRILILAEDPDSFPDLCFDPSPFIAGGIAAAGTLGGAMVNAGAKWGSRTYMRVAKEMAQYNQDLNEAMYNKYQSPVAMMRQYKEAGLNPALLYNQATGNVGNVSAGQVSTNPNDYTSGQSRYGDALSALGSAVDAYQNVISKNASVNNTVASTNAINTEAALNAERTKHEQIQNVYLGDSLKHQLEGLQLSNAQRGLDLELDRQFKWSERLNDLDKKRAETRHLDISGDEKRRRIAFFDTEENALKQNIEESKTRQWQMEKGIELGFGNLAVANYNAQTNRYNYEVSKTNALNNTVRTNIEAAKWDAAEPALKANADYELWRRTGYSPGFNNGSIWHKGQYLMNYFMDNIGKLTGAARDAAGARFMQSK